MLPWCLNRQIFVFYKDEEILNHSYDGKYESKLIILWSLILYAKNVCIFYIYIEKGNLFMITHKSMKERWLDLYYETEILKSIYGDTRSAR